MLTEEGRSRQRQQPTWREGLFLNQDKIRWAEVTDEVTKPG